MTRTIDSQVIPRSQTVLASFRPHAEPIPVCFKGALRSTPEEILSGRLEAVQAAVAGFVREWPLAAASVAAVEVRPTVRPLSNGDEEMFACALTGVWLGRVHSQIQVAHSLFTDLNVDKQLQTWHDRGEFVASDLEGLMWHEFGHVLLTTLVMRAEPLSRSAEDGAFEVIADALQVFSTSSTVIAAAKISKRAMVSRQEMIAEAVSDFGVNGPRAHPVSVAIVMTLAKLWHV